MNNELIEANWSFWVRSVNELRRNRNNITEELLINTMNEQGGEIAATRRPPRSCPNQYHNNCAWKRATTIYFPIIYTAKEAIDDKTDADRKFHATH